MVCQRRGQCHPVVGLHEGMVAGSDRIPPAAVAAAWCATASRLSGCTLASAHHSVEISMLPQHAHLLMTLRCSSQRPRDGGSCRATSPGDIWLHCIAVALLAGTIANGIWQLVAGARALSPLLIGVLWAVYAIVPPLLLVSPATP